jgi:hypothetical protein
MCPFLIETDENEARLVAKTVSETFAILTKWLHLEDAGPTGAENKPAAGNPH